MDELIQFIERKHNDDGTVEMYPEFPNMTSEVLRKTIKQTKILKNSRIQVFDTGILTFSDLDEINNFF